MPTYVPVAQHKSESHARLNFRKNLREIAEGCITLPRKRTKSLETTMSFCQLLLRCDVRSLHREGKGDPEFSPEKRYPVLEKICKVYPVPAQQYIAEPDEFELSLIGVRKLLQSP